MKASLLLLTGLMVIGAQANASSDQAWSDLDKAIIASCVKASQLKDVKPAGTAALFDDSIGYSALLLKGHYPQAHMKNKVGTELCLYQRQSQTAVVTEWDSMLTPAKK
ncbi:MULTISPECIES: hypothetical protein [unclassified Pseudomonas]|uniref:hypothetical protein n=1 Tax=unclassified Pseudomonas TaxID=196821 RepID=UPI002AC8E8FA|nr:MULTISPECIES: hypothetical protein [unclassified Pseudomonas]MEB0040447.1 hypothetical protein [Pseudomonas sp. MH10]MEB0078804.1 hypothetical protein [Pseudomonas sp. MH10out]MEB0089709.1 hypothetical protein [Pseudomonas sp. CCI4.2]MEB0103576.1 hypothetical protein [Pseudomonas sp. CCI3.2]MEB0121299.1 hypothetical protein [Pseudomonas sp. CCI1.2]